MLDLASIYFKKWKFQFNVSQKSFLIKNALELKICDLFTALSQLENDYFCENSFSICQLIFPNSIQRKTS